MTPSPELVISNVGPIEKASLTFGDLTVLVGPQASGKSIALQWFKLLADTDAIKAQLLDYGTDWAGSPDDFLDLYFGEGMHSIWRSGESSIEWRGKPISVEHLVKRKTRKGGDETVFLVPAQRVLSLRDGWPRPFADYGTGDPYAVRTYSEKLRFLMETEFKVGIPLFPKTNRLKADYRNLLTDSIFGHFSLAMNRTHSQKRLVLQEKDVDLPFMVWSAGQREFVPLLLGLYWLMPPAKVARRGTINWVLIEELEMALHPRAISTILLLVVELLARGYKVCLSTHSPQILDFVWAWQILKNTKGASAADLLNIFGARHSQPLMGVATKVLHKTAKVYYFENGQETRDISHLDPSSELTTEATWGGLQEFTAKANEVVANAVTNAEAKRKNKSVRASDAL